jgi:hypothetical protein
MRPSDSGSHEREGDVALELRARRFGFDEGVVGDRMEGGYANDRFRLEADGRSLVLRLMHPPVDAVLRASTDRHPRWNHQRHNLRFLEAVAARGR